MEETVIVILGPTASGKTHLAAQIAHEINGEIISADSRQVYKGMNIGTGKDLSEYQIGQEQIPYHLIDIVNAGEKYNLARFQTDVETAIKSIISNSRIPILCGGSGLYLQSVIQGFNNTTVPENQMFRDSLDALSNDSLKELLEEKGESYDTRKRAIRKLEILNFGELNISDKITNNRTFKVFGLNPSVDLRRQRISTRLKTRIQQEGMIDEVRNLLFEGLSYEMLEYYGLEYKYIAQFIQGFMRYDEMYSKLETEIHRFAKRQMTFFRSMEKKGIEIDWLDDTLSVKDKIAYIKKRSLLS